MVFFISNGKYLRSKLAVLLNHLAFISKNKLHRSKIIIEFLDTKYFKPRWGDIILSGRVICHFVFLFRPYGALCNVVVLL